MNKLKEMDGHEVWTNAFGKRFEERVCVLVEYPYCWNDGKKFKPTSKEVKELWDDYIEAELGTPAQRHADLKAEFGYIGKLPVEQIIKEFNVKRKKAEEMKKTWSEY